MFDFSGIYEAKTIDDAIKALVDNPGAWIIAGGTDTAIALREGAFTGRDLVSIQGIKELKGITLDPDQNIHIKPCTTFREIAEDTLLQKTIPYFCEAVETVGSPQIRTMATVGGNISNGFTTADSVPALFALNAHVTVSGPDGRRTMAIQDYYKGPEQMDLGAGELLTDIILPYDDYHGYTGKYMKYSLREANDIAILGCAVVLKVGEDKKRMDDIRISYAAAAAIPVRAYNTEKAVKGMVVSDEIFDTIGQFIKTDISPITDRRAGSDFRLHLAEVLLKRAIKQVLHDLK